MGDLNHEYKPNYHGYSEESENNISVDKKAGKVIEGTVKRKKKSKLANIFKTDDAHGVISYIFSEIIKPALKKSLDDIFTNGGNMILNGLRTLLWGKDGKPKDTASKISYREYYDNRRKVPDLPVKFGYSYDDVVFTSRGDAEDKLSLMEEIISQYGMISVADYYDCCGVDSNYTDNKYGWTDIRGASIIRVREGYIIKMPKAMPIDR